MPSRLSARDLALTLAVVALWGFTFVPIRWALDEVPPFALAALRFFAAALPAVFFVRRPSMPWRDVVAYGLAIGFFQFGLLFLGMKMGMPAGLSSLVIQLQVSSRWVSRWRGAASGSVASISRAPRLPAPGVVVLAGYKLASGMTGTLTGFLLVVVAGFAWAVGNVIAKRSATAYRADMFALVVWSSLVPPLPLALASYWFEGGPAVFAAIASASPTTWFAVLIMAWGATLFGFGTWNALLHRYPVGLISPFALLIPVSGLFCGWLFLGETLAPWQAAGARSCSRGWR
jgi:O-acetylserine/cysteine efflux transporter